MKGDMYRLFVNANPKNNDTNNMTIRMPTAPMFFDDKYKVSKCIYRLNRYIIESADTELDEHTLVVQLNVPSSNAITTPLLQQSVANSSIDGQVGQVCFLTEITGDTDSCKYYNRTIDNGCIGPSCWGTELEIKLTRIDLGSGAYETFVPDQPILFEFEIELLRDCDCH
tara:strand:+ start:474 stop:980 length:507 start_codon:yes stop_codon:yes gene_type:complete